MKMGRSDLLHSKKGQSLEFLIIVAISLVVLVPLASVILGNALYHYNVNKAISAAAMISEQVTSVSNMGPGNYVITKLPVSATIEDGVIKIGMGSEGRNVELDVPNANPGTFNPGDELLIFSPGDITLLNRPVITSINPTSGKPGSKIDVHGQYSDDGTVTVTLGNLDLVTQKINPNKLKATVFGLDVMKTSPPVTYELRVYKEFGGIEGVKIFNDPDKDGRFYFTVQKQKGGGPDDLN